MENEFRGLSSQFFKDLEENGVCEDCGEVLQVDSQDVPYGDATYQVKILECPNCD